MNRRSFLRGSWLVVTASALATTEALSREQFNIEIARTATKDGLTHGELRINGKAVGLCFENADLKIPAGVYPGFLRYWSGKNFVQGPFGTLGKEGDFLLEVGKVPNRTAILFHGGNKPHHSKGCILLGPVSAKQPLPSDHPLRQLRTLFYGTEVPNATPAKEITIAIYDPA